MDLGRAVPVPAIASVLNNMMAVSQLWMEPMLPAWQLSSSPCRRSAGALASGSLLHRHGAIKIEC